METIQAEWNAVLRQAVIRVKPDYFALSETEREYYRLRLNSEDDFRIRQTVIKELFGFAVSMTEELDAVLETFDDSLYLSLKSTLLPLQAIGGARAVVADSLLMKQQLLIINRSRQRAPNLSALDRFLFGF